MNGVLSSPAPKAKTGTNFKETSAEVDQNVLTLLTVPVHRPEDELDEKLDRLKRHNELVTEVVVGELKKSVEESSAQLLSYAHGGVLISFNRKHSDQALLAAAMVMEKVTQADEPSGLAVRIGLSLGSIEKKRWDTGSPQDIWGEPIEIAKRLVRDVAEPGQIVLDSAACKTADLDLVKARHPNADIYPVSGVELTIHGAEYRRSISELTLDGVQRAPQNRRQLADELGQIQSKAMQLRFKLKEIEDISFQSQSPSDGLQREIRNFSETVDLLDPEDPGREAKDLRETWAAAAEADKDEDLCEANAQLQSAVESLVTIWNEKRAEIRRPGEEGKEAVADCIGAFEKVTTQLNALYKRATRALSGIDQLL